MNNLLRERLAYLQVDLDDNPLLIQHIKESTCQVAVDGIQTALTALKAAGPHDAVGYVLPDFSANGGGPYVGFVVENERDVPPGGQAVKIGADRFAVPEALFNPSTFGIDKLGIVEAVQRSISLCDECIRDVVASKIILSGGTAMMPGFVERLERELASALPQVAPGVSQIRLLREGDGRYDLSAWRGASQIATNEDDLSYLGLVFRDEWQR